MDKLMAGISRFRDNAYPERSARFADLASGQSPKTLMISCADSRVVPELITQSEPGELFVCRNAGNIVPPWQQANGGVSSAIEYAVVALGVTDIVVCGHSDCGAMKGLLAPDALAEMPSVAAWLGHAQAACAAVHACHPGLAGGERLDALVEENVLVQLVHLRGHPSVAAALAKGALRLHGWVFDIESATVRALDGATGGFRQYDGEGPMPVADHGRTPAKIAEPA